MSRPSVLIVEPESARRRFLSERLAELGYEAVPAMDVAEGVRFAEGLGPAVIVASADLPGLADAEAFERLARANGRGSLVLLGNPRGDESEIPQEVRWIPDEAAGGSAAEAGTAEGMLHEPNGRLGEALMERLRVVLLAREVGIEPDPSLEALVGDFTLDPPLEVVRSLARAGFTGRLAMEEGEISFADGEVVAARAGASAQRSVRGLKAFCRLGRRLDGTFRVWPLAEPPVALAAREIQAPVDALVIRAVEDASTGELPPPRSLLAATRGPSAVTDELSPRQQAILKAAHKGWTAGRLLDTLQELDGDLVQEIHELRQRGLLELREPETRVQVITDSTSDLPRDVTRRLGIEIVPLKVLFGDRRYVDGLDLRPREFYELLERGDTHPSTEPPSVEAFDHVYGRHLERRNVVSLHISSRLSETFAHARTAGSDRLAGLPPVREDKEPVSLEVVDSGQASLSLGLLAVFAARLAWRGRSAAEIADICRAVAPRCHTLFVVDTLEYLRRGGRIGRAQAWIGQWLRIKPILGVEKGEVVPVDRVRGGRAAHPRILELLGERLDPDRPVLAGVAHAKAPVWADRLGELLCKRFAVRELLRTEIGPVVGTHAGPGTVGCVVFQPTDEELDLLSRIEDGAGGSEGPAVS